MNSLKITTAACLAGLMSACAPLVLPGPVVPATTTLDGRYRIVSTESQIILDYGDVLELDSRKVDALSKDLSSEIADETNLCARGEDMLTLRVRIDRFENEWPDSPLRLSSGDESVGGWFELIDRQTKAVVFRDRIDVVLPSGDAMRGVGGFDEPPAAQVAAELMGRQLCLRAFGANPRPGRLSNVSPD